MLDKGDKIMLVVPFGAMKKVGEICDVIDVVNNIITFRFGNWHMGQMDFETYEKHFVKVIPKGNFSLIGCTVTVVKEDKSLEPLCVGDKFIVKDIKYDVARLDSVDDVNSIYITTSVLNEFFKVVEKDNQNNTVTVNAEQVDNIIKDSTIYTDTVFGKCTVVSCMLPNGFVIVEYSACVDPSNYNEELGYDICMKKIRDKIFELEGYRLQNEHPVQIPIPKQNTTVTKKHYEEENWINNL